jgi:hypothetical protein
MIRFDFDVAAPMFLFFLRFLLEEMSVELLVCLLEGVFRFFVVIDSPFPLPSSSDEMAVLLGLVPESTMYSSSLDRSSPPMVSYGYAVATSDVVIRKTTKL